MPVTENDEARIAALRGRTLQNKQVPWLIRDDGVIFPNVPLIARMQRFRPYHGDLNASLEERMAYLAGTGPRRKIIDSRAAEPAAPVFDIATASKDELILFAFDEFAADLDATMSEDEIRAEVARIAGIAPVGKPAAEPAPAPQAAEQRRGQGRPRKQAVAFDEQDA